MVHDRNTAHIAIKTTGWAAIALALVTASGAWAASGTADLILTNAKVYTVEKAQPWAQSVAIKDGKILTVGSAAQVARNKGAGTRIVDLGGRLVMPAFGDAHNHPLFGALSNSRCSIVAGKNVEDYKALIAGCLAKAPGTTPFYAVGWTEANIAGAAPTKAMLDAVNSDRPLIIASGDGHSMWVNSKALELAGISKATPDPVNGKIARDPKTGEPTGALYEESAMNMVEKFVPPPSPTEVQNAIIYTMNLFHSLGITNWRDAGVEYDDAGNAPMIEAYRAVRDRGQLTMHVAVDIKWKNERGIEQIPGILRTAERAKSYGLYADSVKYYQDGVIPQHTAAMIEPYEGTSDRAKSNIPASTLDEAIATMEAKGFQAHVHAIGDRAVREALDAFAVARKRNGPKDMRHIITHLNVIDPADQPRFGQLGVYAGFQPTWSGNGEYMDLTKAAIGAKRSTYIYPDAGVVRGGGKIAFGADWPVATANPLAGLQVAVTRTSVDEPRPEPLLPEQSLTLAEAVRSHTINVAEANRNDKETGSIVAGKQADLIVLDHNIFAIPVTDIAKTKVLLTLFAGRPVFGGVGDLKTAADGK